MDQRGELNYHRLQDDGFVVRQRYFNDRPEGHPIYGVWGGCLRRLKVGRQSFAANKTGRAATLFRQIKYQHLQVATPACRHGDADLHKSRAATPCRRTRLVGRQSFAADEGGKRPGNPCRIVSIGMPTYVAV